ncbi:bifunctional hydroxymethylpyrimidine kinase/phosphomethylpyrimidine kinase [Specibacter sp. NPDC057265]|uniref:bifunctional hydroxymethylpyrimidine kinase/phosphomethylpyrimidine kinase n=1 Tax=Specibacter sp. NPDC057265 TaxID=3346075 RepID=UPI00362985F5
MSTTALDSPAPAPAVRRDGHTGHPRILAIAGSDPSGGAGIQADIKTISAHGGYALAAVTALTAQNTQGVQAIHVPPGHFLTAQLDAISTDITVDAVKIGMLGTAQAMAAVGRWLQRTQPPVVVLDPVMVATSGDSLVEAGTRQALLDLLPHTHLVTPNLAELAALLEAPLATTWAQALAQGRELAGAHQVLVLVKGGHLPGKHCPDALVDAQGTLQEFSAPRVDTVNTHGTGCALSSAVATLQAHGGDWALSIQRAKEWLVGALETSAQLQVGGGAGPVNHFHALWGPAAVDLPRSAPGPGEDFSGWLWQQCKDMRAAIFNLDFIKELAAGTLARGHFDYYLAQDALYLGSYSRVLSQASVLAPTLAEQRFWAHSAQQCLEEELALHDGWLDAAPPAPPGPVTRRYAEHLQSTAFEGGYGEVVAAVLPCFWIYADVGTALHADYEKFPGNHPYGAWIESYAATDFVHATHRAIQIMDAAARGASAAQRERMATAFRRSVALELEFFAAPHAREGAVDRGLGD